MIDKKLEANIKKTKDFIEIWRKFYDIFKNATSKNHLGRDKERELLSVRELVNSRYEDLMDSLGVKALKRFIISPSVYNVLSFEKISITSDKRLHALDRDWEESFKFLNGILGRLERKKQRIGEFNKFAFVVKKGMAKARRKQ
jgi:hypothetical protein